MNQSDIHRWSSSDICAVRQDRARMDGLGFLYNNYLMDYDYKVFSHPLYLRPNAVPWATVAPTLIFRGKEIWMAVGRPGSERIFSAISQFLIHVADEHQSIGEAMYAPRLHCSLGGPHPRDIRIW